MHAPFRPSSTCLSFPLGTSCTLTKCGEPSVLLHHTSRTPYFQPPGPFARREISLIRFCPSAAEQSESSSLFVVLCVFPIHLWLVLLVVVVSSRSSYSLILLITLSHNILISTRVVFQNGFKHISQGRLALRLKHLGWMVKEHQRLRTRIPMKVL